MARLILPLVLAAVGLAAGVAAGLALKPDDAPATADAAPPAPAAPGPVVFMEMANPFVIPLIDGARIRSMLMMQIGLEVAEGRTETLRRKEPRLRDAFLRVLFDHANAGGFDGAFTAASPMASLRSALRDSARDIAGEDVRDVLILDMIRQD